MNITVIRSLLMNQEIVWRNHILIRMRQRNIQIKDVVACIVSGEIIEKYDNDYPFPSMLIMGKDENELPIHVVCAVEDDKVWFITTYYPEQKEWMEDLRTRRK